MPTVPMWASAERPEFWRTPFRAPVVGYFDEKNLSIWLNQKWTHSMSGPRLFERFRTVQTKLRRFSKMPYETAVP
jgi:hypothetical protein